VFDPADGAPEDSAGVFRALRRCLLSFVHAQKTVAQRKASGRPDRWVRMRLSAKAFLIGLLSMAALSLVPSGCSRNLSGGDDRDDGDTPYVILDLRVTSVTTTSITLAWTATGDDADVGSATSYDLRILDEPVTEDTWDEAFRYTGEPPPLPAGQTDSVTVSGLEEDSTYYFAISACDEAGNCSNLSNWVSATCFDDRVVEFLDPNLEAVVRLAINKPAGDIRRLDLMPLTALEARDKSIANLAGLESCTSLRFVVLSENHVADLTPLAPLVQMLDIDLSSNAISDVGPLAGMSRLENLKLRNNALVRIDALSHLRSLRYLLLDDNEISDLMPLADLTSLQHLAVEHAAVSSVIPLSALTHLEQLLLGRNQISDVMPLSTLTSIKVLFLNENQISEISPLLGNQGLGSGDVIQLMVNPLSERAKYVDIPALRELGVTVAY
jgi:hypothetical protein